MASTYTCDGIYQYVDLLYYVLFGGPTSRKVYNGICYIALNYFHDEIYWSTGVYLSYI